VLREDRHVHQVIVYERSRPWTLPALVRRLRRARYDAVVDPMATAASLSTLLLVMASGARHRIGVAGRGIDEALTVPVVPRPGAKHLVDHLSALAAAFGLDPASPAMRPHITLADEERERADARWRSAGGGTRLLVNISAGKPRRRWPDASFAELLRRVHAAHPGLTTLVIGGPDEAASVAQVASAGGAAGAETPGLRDAFALVATADVALTPNTSVSHAASAFRTPAVVLHHAGLVDTWGLYHAPGRDLSSPTGELSSLAVEPVVEAVEEMLKATTKYEIRNTKEASGSQ
jgi:ADP-heptose:LPS heptosyltransferase